MYHQFYDKTFMSICSEKTLQTNAKGFFFSFADHVLEKAGEKWVKNVFGKLQNDKERIRIIYEANETKDVVAKVLSNVQEIYRPKSAETSASRRLDAEEQLAKGDLPKALNLYSQSVLRSPPIGHSPHIDDGHTLSLGLLGRAKVLMQMGYYDLGLNDLQLALKEGLPLMYQVEAFWRSGICYKALNDLKRSDVAFKLAEKLFNKKEKLAILEADKRRTYKLKQREDRREVPNVVGGRHPLYKDASRKIAVKKTANLGRFVVASEQVKTGDTLVVEEPYVACLLPEMFGTHCHHCFERFIAPVGCTNCSSIAFCTTKCREAAAAYHQYECKFLDLMIGSGMSVLAHAALRMITQITPEKCKRIYNNRQSEWVYNLCTNSSVRLPADFLQRTLMAAFLLRCLQKSNYFGHAEESQADKPSEEELQVGELLLFHLQMLQFNAHEIYETRHTANNRLEHSKISYIGVAIYPTVSLFNHDCYPAVARYFVGKKIVIRALRPISVRSVVAENYGPIFTRRILQDRQRSLSSRYWFNCQCEACVKNWPGLDNGLADVSLRIRCTSKKCPGYFTLPLTNVKLKCPKCEKNVYLGDHMDKLKWCLEQYELGFKALYELNPRRGIEILCPAIDVFHKVSLPPHKETHLAQEALRTFMADFGNTSETLVKKKKNSN